MRMRNTVFVALVVGAFTLVNHAWAMVSTTSDPANELEAGSQSALTFGKGTDTAFGLSGAYSRLLMDMVQGTGMASFNITSHTVGSVVDLRALVGPTINYSLANNGLKDAFYLRILGGIAWGSNSTSGTTVSSADFAYDVEVGKRFELFTNAFWKPAFRMDGTTAGGTNPVFSVIPAQFSFFFQ